MNWQKTEPPKDMQLLAYGYPIADISGLRGDITHAIVEWYDWDDVWRIVGGDDQIDAFEIVGWCDIPDYTHSVATQPVPEGNPKYAVGDVTQYETRYEGTQDVTITSVHVWPNGFYYGLDKTWNLGHGNGGVGADEIEYFDDGTLYQRPISEYELDYRSKG